jgi:predicted ferric reductase
LQQGQRTNRQALVFSGCLIACLLAPIAIVMLWPVPAPVNPLWDWANAMGYLAVAISLFLFIYKGRAHTFPPFSGRFFANFHRDLGYIVVLLLAGHVGVLLVEEPLLLEHLKPTAPLHMMSGLLALVLMLLLVCTSIPVVRRRLWPDYHLFRHLHGLAAVAIVLLVFFHVLVSGFYLNSEWKIGLATATGMGILLYYARGMYQLVPAAMSRVRDSARYSHMISYGSVALVLLLCLALILFAETE